MLSPFGMPPTPAASLQEAAFVHCSVFTEPVWAWPDDLVSRVPPFDALFVDGRPVPAGTPDPPRLLRDRLARTPGPVKLLLAGQRGSGKSWMLRRVAATLGPRFHAVTLFPAEAGAEADVRALIERVGAALDAPRPAGAELVVLLDDLDKLDAEAARRAVGGLLALPCRMVLTWPFALSFDGAFPRGAGAPIVLPNVPVVDLERRGVPEPALAFFRAVLAGILDPALVDEAAFRDAVRLSAGVPRAFGLLVRQACLHAEYAGARKLDARALALAERELRIGMLRASQSVAVRGALAGIRRAKKLASDEDRRLFDQDLLVEYVDGEPWYDVHPILAPAIDAWAATRA